MDSWPSVEEPSTRLHPTCLSLQEAISPVKRLNTDIAIGVDNPFIAIIDAMRYRCYCIGIMDILLVRFPRDKRTFIRKQAKKDKTSEAEVVRQAVGIMRDVLTFNKSL